MKKAFSVIFVILFILAFSACRREETVISGSVIKINERDRTMIIEPVDAPGRVVVYTDAADIFDINKEIIQYSDIETGRMVEIYYGDVFNKGEPLHITAYKICIIA